MRRYEGTAWARPLATFLRLMGEEGRAGYTAEAAGDAIACLVGRAGRAPPADAGFTPSNLLWAALTRSPPRVEMIARRWMVWTTPRLLPDRVTDWAVGALFGL